MKKLFIVLLIALVTPDIHGDVRVKGYFKGDGTYVAPHYRSNPNSNFNDNWSTKPNVNPYTGKRGKKVTPPIRDYEYYSPRKSSFPRRSW